MYRSFLTAFLIALTFSCGKEPGPASDAKRLGEMEQEILTLVQDKACGGERICGTLAFGVKPCGGPWKYLVYSLKAADLVVLRQKVNAYNELNGLLNMREGRSSDCALVQPPAVSCQDGQCKPDTNQ